MSKNIVSKVFSSYHSNGVIIRMNDSWLILNDEETIRLNQIIEESIKDKSKHRKKNSDGTWKVE